MAIDEQTVKKIGGQVKDVGQDMIDAVAPPKKHSGAVTPVAKQSVPDGLFPSSQRPGDVLRDARKSLDDILRGIDRLLADSPGSSASGTHATTDGDDGA